MKFKTFIDYLHHRVAAMPRKTVYTHLVYPGEIPDTTRKLTFAELDLQAGRIAARLQDLDVKNKLVLLIYPQGLDYITAFLGCMYAGAIAVPCYPPMSARLVPRFQSIIRDSVAKIGLCTHSIKSILDPHSAENPGADDFYLMATDVMHDDRDLNFRPAFIDENSVAFIQYTSGSTSSPKGVVVKHLHLLNNLRMIERACRLSQDTVSLSWLPQYHDMGLIAGLLQPIFSGYPLYLLSPLDFLQKPLRWLKGISDVRATFSGGPNFAFDLCIEKITVAEIETLDLGCLEVLANGAEPIRPQTMVNFCRKFSTCGFREEAMTPCYGLAESTLFVTCGTYSPVASVRRFRISELERNRAVVATSHVDARELAGSGQVPEKDQLIIVDPESLRSLPPACIGEVWVSTDSVADGYWNRPEETKSFFKAYVSETGQGPFLRTGDLGFVYQGELFITGRLKDLIIINGRNHSPQDIERTAEEAHPRLRRSCNAAFSVFIDGHEKLVIVQEIKKQIDAGTFEPADVAAAIRGAVAAVHHIDVHDIVLIEAGEISKTTSGKIQRKKNREKYLNAGLPAVFAMRKDKHAQTASRRLADRSPEYGIREPSHAESIRRWLIEKTAQKAALPSDRIDPQASFISYGLGSLDAVALSGDLQDWLGFKVPPTALYDYPSIERLTIHLVEQVQRLGTLPSVAIASPLCMQRSIAIIGIGCRFPGGANSPETFWQLLCAGVDAIGAYPRTRPGAAGFYAPRMFGLTCANLHQGGWLESVDAFDAEFFNLSPRELESLDPQQRLLLEVSWEALEDAGYAANHLRGSSTGVFVGICSGDYRQIQTRGQLLSSIHACTGNATSVAANRLSYFYDFRGPSLAMDTACSSSMVAVHAACSHLRGGECDLALAGGVNLILSPLPSVLFSKAGMLSAHGRCKTFDRDADGYVRGEGCALIVLKRYEEAVRDGDHIYAVIKGGAVNQDGRTNGLTAPNGPAQVQVMRSALKDARLTASRISYIEAHGTGTALGDPIEINALGQVYLQERSEDQPCWIGSVKTNIGHLEASAGIAGVIKTALMLRHGQIPAHLHLSSINPHTDSNADRFRIPARLEPWTGGSSARAAGVSSFGFGGTNAHLILEQDVRQSPAEAVAPREHILVFSAKHPESLLATIRSFRHYLERNAESAHLADIAFTLQVGRVEMEERLALVVSTPAQLREALETYQAGGQESQSLFRGRARPSFFRENPPPEVPDWREVIDRSIRAKDLVSIARLWVQGCPVDWRHLHSGLKHRRVALPTYAFRRKSYWVTRTPARKDPDYKQFPLIENLDPMDCLQAGIAFKPSITPFRPEIRGQDMVLKNASPQALCIEMALEALSAVRGPEVEDFTLAAVQWPDQAGWDDTLPIEEPHRTHPEAFHHTFQLIRQKDGVAFQLYAADQRTVCFMGVSDPSMQAFETPEGDAPHERIDSHCRQMPVEKGAFDLIREIRFNSHEIVARLNADRIAAELGDFIFHPAILDAAFQAIGLCRRPEPGTPYRPLPDSIEHLHVRRSPWVASIHIRETQSCIYDMELRDEKGCIQAMLRSCRMKPAANSVADHFFVPMWEPVRPKQSPPASAPGTTLVVHADASSRQLMAAASRTNPLRQLIEIVIDPAGKRRPSGWLKKLKGCLVTHHVGTSVRTRDQASPAPPSIDQVIFFATCGAAAPEGRGGGRMESFASSDLFAFLVLVGCLIEHAYQTRPIHITIVTNGIHPVLPEDRVIPFAAPLSGFAKSCAREFAQWRVECLDIRMNRDHSLDLPDKKIFAALLARHPENIHATCPDLALRQGTIYTRVIRRLDLSDSGEEEVFRQHGVYLIVGGSGGIGTALSLYLAGKKQARLILTGRGALNDERLLQLERIRKLGGEAVYLQADIVRRKAMQAAVNLAEKTFGRIHGVFHSAIVLHDRSIRNLDSRTLSVVLAPKVQGSLNLYACFKDKPLDFMVFFSSVQSFAGNAGQGNYAAASAFEDAFALYANQQAGFPVKVINWGYWGSLGIVSSERYRQAMRASGLLSIEPEEGLPALETVLRLPRGAPQVIFLKAERHLLESTGCDLQQDMRRYPVKIPSLIEITWESLQAQALKDSMIIDAFSEMEDYCHDALLSLLQSMGYFRTAGERTTLSALAAGAGICKRHERLFMAMLDLLRQQGFLQLDAQHVLTTAKVDDPATVEKLSRLPARCGVMQQRYAHLHPYLTLIGTCLKNIPAILENRVPATEILFPNNTMALVGDIYGNNLVADHFNSLIANSLETYIAKRLAIDPQAKIRLLEVGAGTGATTAMILDRIASYGENVTYVYTDISVAFLNHGKAQFGERFAFMDFLLFDLEKGSSDLSAAPGSFDIVIASNVLHATRHIRDSLGLLKSLLKANGWLVINELTAVQSFLTLTFGLLDGWWAALDTEERLPFSPLLSPDRWKAILIDEGYREIRSTADMPGPFRHQSLFIAESDGLARIAKPQAPLVSNSQPSAPFPAGVAGSMPPMPRGQDPDTQYTFSARDEQNLEDALLSLLIEMMAQVLKSEPAAIDSQTPFTQFGLDSILGIEFIEAVNNRFQLQLNTLILFDHASLLDLCRFLLKEHEDAIRVNVGAQRNDDRSAHHGPEQDDPIGSESQNASPSLNDGMIDLLNKLKNEELSIDDVSKMLEVD